MPRRSIVTPVLITTLLAGGLAAAPAAAQTSPFESVNQRFDEVAPRIGEPLPDLTVYDLQGEEVNVRDLVRGQHTVVVLGCLT